MQKLGDIRTNVGLSKEKYNTLNVHESGSIWNYALSPGWTHQEVEVLMICLKKFGVGKWTAIRK